MKIKLHIQTPRSVGWELPAFTDLRKPSNGQWERSWIFRM